MTQRKISDREPINIKKKISKMDSEKSKQLQIIADRLRIQSILATSASKSG